MIQKNKDIKAVFFDLDRTLFDQKKAWRKGLIKTIDRYPEHFEGIEKEKVIEEFIKAGKVAHTGFLDGESVDKARMNRCRTLLKNLGLEESLAPKLTKSFMDIHTQIYAPIDGAQSLVKELSKVYFLGLITNGDQKSQTRKLNTLGLKKYFQKLTFSEDIGIRKPDPRIFIKAIESMGENAENSVYIGDSYKIDISGASKVGMKTCWFNFGEKNPEKRDINPDCEVRSFREIPEILTG